MTKRKRNLNLWDTNPKKIEFGYTCNSIIIVTLLIIFLYFFNFFE